MSAQRSHRDIIDYQVFTIDLSVARTDILVSSFITGGDASGKGFTLLKETTGATWSLKLVKVTTGLDGDAIDQTMVNVGGTIGVDFKDLKITNSAQAGVNMTLMFLR